MVIANIKVSVSVILCMLMILLPLGTKADFGDEIEEVFKDNGGFQKAVFDAQSTPTSYEIGGANPFKFGKAEGFKKNVTLDLKNIVDINLGCNLFDGSFSVDDLIKKGKEGVLAIFESAEAALSTAVTSLPLYILALFDANAFNNIVEVLDKAKAEFDFDVASCQDIEKTLIEQNPNSMLALLNGKRKQQAFEKEGMGKPGYKNKVKQVNPKDVIRDSQETGFKIDCDGETTSKFCKEGNGGFKDIVRFEIEQFLKRMRKSEEQYNALKTSLGFSEKTSDEAFEKAFMEKVSNSLLDQKIVTKGSGDNQAIDTSTIVPPPFNLKLQLAMQKTAAGMKKLIDDFNKTGELPEQKIINKELFGTDEEQFGDAGVPPTPDMIAEIARSEDAKQAQRIIAISSFAAINNEVADSLLLLDLMYAMLFSVQDKPMEQQVVKDSIAYLRDRVDLLMLSVSAQAKNNDVLNKINRDIIVDNTRAASLGAGAAGITIDQIVPGTNVTIPNNPSL